MKNLLERVAIVLILTIALCAMVWFHITMNCDLNPSIQQKDLSAHITYESEIIKDQLGG